MVFQEERLFRRDMMPNDRLISIPEESELKIVVQTSKKYDKQLADMSSLDRAKIKSLRKDIISGYIYEDGPAGGDTHFLSDFSHKDSHVLSKKINEEDRLNYRVYRAIQVDPSENKFECIIVLESCKGHELNGTPDYVKDKEYKKLKQNKNSRNN